MSAHSAKNDFARPIDRTWCWDAASAQSTKALFLIGAVFLLPVILMDTGWSSWVRPERRKCANSSHNRTSSERNTWLIVNVGGGPTPEKPSVTLSVPDPDKISSFMHIRVADIQACYELWRSRGAEFITEPKDKYGETLCYIRDPDGYMIEVAQNKPGFAYG
jgi:hypothetical protein